MLLSQVSIHLCLRSVLGVYSATWCLQENTHQALIKRRDRTDQKASSKTGKLVRNQSVVGDTRWRSCSKTAVASFCESDTLTSLKVAFCGYFIIIIIDMVYSWSTAYKIVFIFLRFVNFMVFQFSCWNLQKIIQMVKSTENFYIIFFLSFILC